MHHHVETQAVEGLEKGRGISVRSAPDGHTCGSQAPVYGEQSSASPGQAPCALRGNSQLESRPTAPLESQLMHIHGGPLD